MSTKVVQFSVDFIYQFKHKINRELPQKTMRALNMNTKIRAVMNEKDLKIFNRKMDNFNADELKKKINSLLNKLSKDNFETIYQKVSEILKNRKVLIEYAIKNLINKAVLQSVFIDVYAKFYTKIYNKKTQKIFENTFNELINVLKGKTTSENTDYDQLCKYMKDKMRFINLFLFLSSLYKNDIIKENVIINNINYLEETILKSTKEENEKYADAYKNFIIKLNCKKYINLEKIKEIKNVGVLKPRMKFAMMDVEDLYKKL